MKNEPSLAPGRLIPSTSNVTLSNNCSLNPILGSRPVNPKLYFIQNLKEANNSFSSIKIYSFLVKNKLRINKYFLDNAIEPSINF